MPAGSSACWPSCNLSCGSGTQPKSAPKQKTDRQDAQLILRLMLEDRFPRIWVPSWENPYSDRHLALRAKLLYEHPAILRHCHCATSTHDMSGFEDQSVIL